MRRLLRRFAQFSEVAEAESLAAADFIPKIRILFPEIEKGIHVSVVGFPELAAYIAGSVFLADPHSDGVSAALRFFQFFFQRGLPGPESGEGFLHFADHSAVMGFQDPGVSQRIPVVEHFLKMGAAEAGPVRHVADIGFHVGSAASQNKIQQILFDAALNVTERTFVSCVHRVVQGDGI